MILFIMCLVAGIVNGVWHDHANESSQYFEFGSIGGTPAKNGVITFWTCIILFQNLVPISLYISIEIVKTLQVYFIWSDLDMYYEQLDYPCTPKSWSISDDLGQIEYIFSDKTGTLTQNVMEYRKCTINGVVYGEAFTEAMLGMQKRLGKNADEEAAQASEHISQDRALMFKHLTANSRNQYIDEDDVTFVSSNFVRDLYGENGPERARRNHHFMQALALCHSVLTEELSQDPPRIAFKAQSPDEAALVATARDMGFCLIERNSRGLIIEEQGVRKEYEVLNTLEFNSSRKRMSAIVRAPGQEGVTLFCKGADNVIFSRLVSGQQQELKAKTNSDLEVFSNEGKVVFLCI